MVQKEVRHLAQRAKCRVRVRRGRWTHNGPMEVDQAMRAYYERGDEAERLEGGMESGPLEFERTKELIGRFLPERSLDVVDVGDGPGHYAAWLADLGHRVHLSRPDTPSRPAGRRRP